MSMKTKAIASILAVGVAAGVLAACATKEEPSKASLKTSQERIQQVDLPIGPTFIRCGEGKCPERTPKTIAVQQPQVAATKSPEVTELPRKTAPEAKAQDVLIERVVVRFAWAKADLSEVEKSKLRQTAQKLLVATRVRVVGRTDGTGAEAFNDRLANERAQNVMDYLGEVLNKAEASKVELGGKGLCCYVADNKTKQGRSQNRRAEVEIYGLAAPEKQGE
jgi:outer membrane protein OmpA-like peptidoglycan-associated protein